MLKALTGAEHQRDAPHTCQTDYRVDNTAEQRGLSTADPSHNVKLEQTNASPVQSSQGGQNQRNAIKNHNQTFNSFPCCYGKNHRRGLSSFIWKIISVRFYYVSQARILQMEIFIKQSKFF